MPPVVILSTLTGVIAYPQPDLLAAHRVAAEWRAAGYRVTVKD